MPKTSPRTQAKTLKRPKLRLSKETLKDLTPGSAKAVKGGISNVGGRSKIYEQSLSLPV